MDPSVKYRRTLSNLDSWNALNTSTGDIQNWLDSKYMGDYTYILSNNGYTNLRHIIQSTTKEELYIISLFDKPGHRLKIRIMIENLKKENTANQQPTKLLDDFHSNILPSFNSEKRDSITNNDTNHNKTESESDVQQALKEARLRVSQLATKVPQMIDDENNDDHTSIPLNEIKNEEFEPEGVELDQASYYEEDKKTNTVNYDSSDNSDIEEVRKHYQHTKKLSLTQGIDLDSLRSALDFDTSEYINRNAANLSRYTPTQLDDDFENEQLDSDPISTSTSYVQPKKPIKITPNEPSNTQQNQPIEITPNEPIKINKPIETTLKKPSEVNNLSKQIEEQSNLPLSPPPKRKPSQPTTSSTLQDPTNNKKTLKTYHSTPPPSLSPSQKQLKMEKPESEQTPTNTPQLPSSKPPGRKRGPSVNVPSTTSNDNATPPLNRLNRSKSSPPKSKPNISKLTEKFEKEMKKSQEPKLIKQRRSSIERIHEGNTSVDIKQTKEIFKKTESNVPTLQELKEKNKNKKLSRSATTSNVHYINPQTSGRPVSLSVFTNKPVPKPNKEKKSPIRKPDHFDKEPLPLKEKPLSIEIKKEEKITPLSPPTQIAVLREESPPPSPPDSPVPITITPSMPSPSTLSPPQPFGGIMLKRGTGFLNSRFKERFFTLAGGTLYWFKSEGEKEVLGMIEIREPGLTLHLVDNDESLEIITKKKTYVFKGTKRYPLRIWYDKLMENYRYFNRHMGSNEGKELEQKFNVLRMGAIFKKYKYHEHKRRMLWVSSGLDILYWGDVDKSVKGSISVSDVVGVEPGCQDAKIPENAFTIVAKGRILELEANSIMMKNEWIELLNLLIKYYGKSSKF